MPTESNWDSHWEEQSRSDFWQKPAGEVIELIDSLDKPRIRDVLDLGCGMGRHALAFAEHGFNVTAVDNSQYALNLLRQKVTEKSLNVKIIEGSYSEDLFSGESFDLVLAYNVLYHGYRESFHDAIDLVYGWLRPEGLFFFTCPNRCDAKYGNGEKAADDTYRSQNSVHPGDIHYFASEEDIVDFLSKFNSYTQNFEEHYWYNQGTRQFSSNRLVLARK